MEKKYYPIIALAVVVFTAVLGNIFLEIFPDKSWPKIFTVSVVGLGGTIMFYIAAAIKQKNDTSGKIAIAMALVLKLSAFIYVWYGSCRFVWGLGLIEKQVFDDYVFMLMMIAHMLILFCDFFIYFFADPTDEFEAKMKQAETRVKEAELKADEFEAKMNLAEVVSKEYESNMNLAQNEKEKIEVSMNLLRDDLEKIEASLKLCTNQAKKYEEIKPIVEAVMNKAIPYGNTYLVYDEEIGRLQGWKANERNKPIKLSSGLMVHYPNKN